MGVERGVPGAGPIARQQAPKRVPRPDAVYRRPTERMPHGAQVTVPAGKTWTMRRPLGTLVSN
jgi:hypothetical protein